MNDEFPKLAPHQREALDDACFAAAMGMRLDRKQERKMQDLVSLGLVEECLVEGGGSAWQLTKLGMKTWEHLRRA